MTDLTPEWLAKDSLDVGLFTNQLDAQLAFWQQEVGLAFDHMLPLGGGVRQHRHDLDGAVLKLNHSRHDLLPRIEGGYVRLIIAKEGLNAPRDLTDPDGNKVQLVPRREHGLHHWAIEVETPNEADFLAHYRDALGLPQLGNHACAVTVGKSAIVGVVKGEACQAVTDDMARIGFRYTTIQVKKVDPVHAAVLAAGGAEGAAPKTLGETARISFVRDKGGNWMELSQRASLVGSLEA